MEARLLSPAGARALSRAEVHDTAARDGGTLWLDFTVVAGFLVVTAVVAAKTYPRAIL